MARQFTSANSEYLVGPTGRSDLTLPLTMACWFYRDSTPGNDVLISTADASATAHWRNLGANGNTVIMTSRAGVGEVTAIATGTFGSTWHHACGITITDSNRWVYLDGSGTSGQNTTSNAPSNIDRIGMGAEVGSSVDRYFNGRIAEAGIWDVQLTTVEIDMLAAGVSPRMVRPASLIWHAPMLPKTGNDFDVISGEVLTDNATVTSADHPRIFMPRGAQVIPIGTPAAPPGLLLNEDAYTADPYSPDSLFFDVAGIETGDSWEIVAGTASAGIDSLEDHAFGDRTLVPVTDFVGEASFDYILFDDDDSAGTITGAVDNGSGLVRITQTAHLLETDDGIYIEGLGGLTPDPNEHGYRVTRIDANTYDLQDSTFGGTYTSGGDAYLVAYTTHTISIGEAPGGVDAEDRHNRPNLRHNLTTRRHNDPTVLHLRVTIEHND